MEPQHLNCLHHKTVQLGIGHVVGLLLAYLLGKHGYVLVEGLGRAHLATGDARLARCTRCQFALLKDEREQGEEWMSVGWEEWWEN